MAALLLALACKLPAYSPSDRHSHGGGADTPTEVDADEDGYDASVDCNDADASVHPGTKETCGNGQDDNCNGSGDGCSWSGEVTLEGWDIWGSEPEELFGSAIAVCDADGDGQQDLVVGAEGTNDYAGAVHVFYGPLGDDIARQWTILGTGPSTALGRSIDCQSDMTGDGAADLLIGEPDETGKSPGTMYVVPGGDVSGVAKIADAFLSAWTGKFTGDRLGYGVVALDADGYDPDEIAVVSIGTPSWTTEFGATYVVGPSPGTHSAYSADASVVGTASQRLMGTAGNAGDMNGDGIDELAVTANLVGYPWDVVLLYQEPLVAALSTDDADVEIEGNESFIAGSTQLEHADLNGDAYDDLLVGSPGDEGNNGAVLVFHGPVFEDVHNHGADVELAGANDSMTGKAIASPGDLDGDGNGELLIGAPGAGTIYLHYGGEPGSFELDEDAHAWWWRPEAYSDLGAALGVGELTGDDIGELAFGAPLAGDENNGAVVLLPSVDL